MSELKRAVSTQLKIKVIRAIESEIRMQTVADTMGLTLETVKEIRSRTNADIKAVTSFLQTATTTQKKMMAQVVRSSGGNELSSRRESLGGWGRSPHLADEMNVLLNQSKKKGSAQYLETKTKVPAGTRLSRWSRRGLWPA